MPDATIRARWLPQLSSQARRARLGRQALGVQPDLEALVPLSLLFATSVAMNESACGFRRSRTPIPI
jgi:hypothetical protein